MLRNGIRIIADVKPSQLFKASFTTSSCLNEKWDLLTAVCLERKPVVIPNPNDLETKFKKYLQDVEYERSLKSDHEVRHEREVKQLELLKKGELEADVDASLKNTAQDFVDACMEELTKFKPASLITEDDKKNNIASLNRKLNKHLVLVTNQNLGSKDYYLLPQGIRQDGETLRQTAERVLKESCGPNVKAQFFGNAPCGFYKYKYPKTVQSETGAVGAKVFFYIARHKQGQLPLNGVEYKWLDRKELYEQLPSNYRDKVAQFLIDED